MKQWKIINSQLEFLWIFEKLLIIIIIIIQEKINVAFSPK